MRRYWLPLILAVALALRLAGLGSADFWYDEAFTGILSRLSLGEAIAATAGDTHPPGYYLITWLVWHIGGANEFWLRLPSVIAGMGSIWLTYRLGKRLAFSEGVCLGAAAFMAVSGFQLHFSQEARQYEIFQCLVLAALLAVLNRRYVLFGLAGLGMAYVHNYWMFYWPFLALPGFAEELKRPIRVLPENVDPFYQDGPAYRKGWVKKSDESRMGKVLVGVLIPAFGWMPWVYVLLGQMETVASGYWIQPVTPGSTLYALYQLLWGFSMPEKLQPVAVVIGFALALIALWYGWQNGQKKLVLLAVGPLMLAVAMSVVWKPVLLFRGLIGSVPAFVLLGAYAFSQTKRTALIGALLVVPLITAGVIGHYKYNPTNKGDITSVIQQVRDEWHEGDTIYHVNDGTAVGWWYYAPDLPQFELPECQPPLGALTPATRRAMGLETAELASGRAWIIYSSGPTSRKCEDEYAADLLADADEFSNVRDDELVKSGVWIREH